MLQKMIGFFKKWLVKTEVSQDKKEVVETPVKADVTKKKSSVLEDLEAYLFARYDFRFNVLTEQTEYRPKGECDFCLVS